MKSKEDIIREKVRAGLTRAQAEQVVAAQEAHDAKKAEKKPANPKSK